MNAALALVRPVVLRLGLIHDADALGDGLLGLAEAHAYWAPEHGVSFDAYARIKIRQRVLHGRRDWTRHSVPTATATDYGPGPDDPETAAAAREFWTRLTPAEQVATQAFLVGETTTQAAEMLGCHRSHAGVVRRRLAARYRGECTSGPAGHM
jgi:hypothetical protein